MCVWGGGGMEENGSLHLNSEVVVQRGNRRSVSWWLLADWYPNGKTKVLQAASEDTDFTSDLRGLGFSLPAESPTQDLVSSAEEVLMISFFFFLPLFSERRADSDNSPLINKHVWGRPRREGTEISLTYADADYCGFIRGSSGATLRLLIRLRFTEVWKWLQRSAGCQLTLLWVLLGRGRLI